MKDRERKEAAKAFKDWVLSLSWQELSIAAQIPLTADDESLLREMVSCHVPPETPVHPKSCPSKTFVFDGRSPAERKQYRARHSPRLLRLVVEDDDRQATFLQSLCHHHDHHDNHAEIPNRKRRGGRKGREQQTLRYSCAGRNFVTPSGDRWSVPPTLELQNADRQIVELLRLVPVQQSASCSMADDSATSGNIKSVLQWDLSSDNDSHHRATKVDMKVDCRVAEIYRLWFLSSRGNLGTSGGHETHPRAADWIRCTEDWFSLAMYLVSRLEVVLYRKMRAQQHSPDLLLCTEPFSTKTWQQAMRLVLTKDVENIASNTNPRKSMFWQLLDEGLIGPGLTPCRNAALGLDKLYHECSLPLLLLDSMTEHLWNELRIIHQQEEARRIEKELLANIEDEETVKTTPNKKQVPSSSKGSKKRRKKKNTSVRSSSTESPLITNEDVSIQGKDSSEGDDGDDGVLVEPIVKTEDKTISREQNRNLVLAWSIMDDVLDTVFEKIGLSGSQPFHENEAGLVPVGTKVNTVKHTRFMKTKSVIPVPSRSTQASGQHKITRSAESSAKRNVSQQQKTGPSKSVPRPLPIDETEDFDPPLDQKQQQQQNHAYQSPNASFYQPNFLTPQSGPFSGGKAMNSDETNLQGLGHNSPFDPLTGSPWYKPDLTEIPLWEPHNYASLEQWGTLQSPFRDRSIMEEFFRTQRERELQKDENQMASSTIASIASSTEDVDVRVEEVMGDLDEAPLILDLTNGSEEIEGELAEDGGKSSRVISMDVASQSDVHSEILATQEAQSNETLASESSQQLSSTGSRQAINTPSAVPSPILVSLEDIRGISKDILVAEKERDSSSIQQNPPSIKSFASVPIPTGSLPNSPQNSRPRFSSSLSRESLRITLSDEKAASVRTPKRSPSAARDAEAVKRHGSFRMVAMKSRDDTEIQPRGSSGRSTDVLTSYRNAAARSLKSYDDQDVRQAQSSLPQKHETDPPNQQRVLGPFPFDPTEGFGSADRCTRSEVGQDEFAYLHESRRSNLDDGDNITVTRDGSTTITSALSQRETEESLREERDTYRDLCLTLGAEVASLRNLIAAYRGSTTYPTFDNNGCFPHSNGNYQFFDPDSVLHIVQRFPRQQTMAAMSDAGFRAEHESMASEDDITREKNSVAHRAQFSASATVGGSDISVEHSIRREAVPVAIPSLRNSYYQLPMGRFHSRLGIDILHFVESINQQLQKQESRRAKAVERMTRLVKTVWPRAQVKVYGSHVTGLCLPSSDVDFVICLPAVHKNAPAVAPGPLEGRNAINETSQKLLARKLKSESWIDTRSMQLIDRTVVPVIKVSTKDTRARAVHLDITFDSPSHHGVEAVDMVLDIMQELPMLRPLMLILKRSLDDKNLLSAYKGGLSSYGLFLMTARYLQEQSSSWQDCGSLLMGFLDFYGNHFNARTTGISVRNRLYFARPNYGPPTMQAQPMWPPQMAPRHHMRAAPTGNDKSFARRNSFNDKGGIDGVRGTTTTIERNERYPTVGFNTHPVTEMDPNQPSHGMPTFEFDPLFLEDPLSPGNNVGRNAFRFPQIQRSFSDAHRALCAALEWDLESTEELQDSSEYPLLKSLLRREDVVCDL